jgi:hypothetical protein
MDANYRAAEVLFLINGKQRTDIDQVLSNVEIILSQ